MVLQICGLIAKYYRESLVLIDEATQTLFTDLFQKLIRKRTGFDQRNLKHQVVSLTREKRKEFFHFLLDLKQKLPQVLICPSIFFQIFQWTDDLLFFQHCLSSMADLKDIESFSDLLWNIASVFFLRNDLEEIEVFEYREAFLKLATKAKQSLMSKGALDFPALKKPPQVIAIISPQILSMRHSPTREAINLACMLEKYHGCKVIIINTNSMSFENRFNLDACYLANVNEGLIGWGKFEVSYLEFEKVTLHYFGMQAKPNTMAKLEQFCDCLKEMEVDAVISHGENHFFQQIIYGALPSMFATTGSPLPFAKHDAYLVPITEFKPSIQTLAKKLGHQGLFLPRPMLVTPEDNAIDDFNFEEFKVPKNAVVGLVVSTRANDEIDKNFIEIIHHLLESCPFFYVAIAGTESLDFYHQFKDSSRVINLGFQENLPAVCRKSSFYLNPIRKGGGTSAQTALLNSLPVVTMDYGHIASVVSSPYRQKTMEQYLAFAKKLILEPAFLASEKKEALAHFKENLSIHKQVREIYEALCNPVGDSNSRIPMDAT